ncbi:MAG: carbohydrate ABC transporter permease, partial [Clostridiales bacterium]|nr:carbohydrate ABC transporter permease [Clostridiales bacterium]
MIRRSNGERLFDALNAVFMLFVIFVTVYPFWYLICASFSKNYLLVAHDGLLFWPQGFSLGAYKATVTYPLLITGYRNIFLILILALPYNLIMTLFAGYFIAAKNMLFKKPIVFLLLFTMFFGGGLIPSYLNMRELGLYNNIWALVIP